MEKIWLKSYPPGVPAEIDVERVRFSRRPVREELPEAIAANTAYINMGKGISYAELDRLTAQFAAYLQVELGLPKGARVAVMMPNMPAVPGVLCSASCARATPW